MDLSSWHLRLISFHYRKICRQLAMQNAEAGTHILQAMSSYPSYYIFRLTRCCFVCFSWHETSTVNSTVARERDFLHLCHICFAKCFTIQSCSNTVHHVGQCHCRGTTLQVRYPFSTVWLSRGICLTYSFIQMCSECFKFQGTQLGVQEYVICQEYARSRIEKWVTHIFRHICKIVKKWLLALSCLSARPCGRTWLSLDVFLLNWYLRIFQKSVKQIHVSLKSDKNSGCFNIKMCVHLW
jgi:hypothetical protein